jgi:hypothetical protein
LIPLLQRYREVICIAKNNKHQVKIENKVQVVAIPWILVHTQSFVKDLVQYIQEPQGLWGTYQQCIEWFRNENPIECYWV